MINLSVLTELLSRRISVLDQPKNADSIVFQYMSISGGNHIIMTNEGTGIPIYTDSAEHSGSCIAAGPCENIEKTISSCVDEYTLWREACLLKAASENNLNEMLDLCASILGFPIALFDESLAMTAFAGEFDGSVQGTIWEEVLNTRMSRPEIYSKEESDMIAQHLNSDEKSFVWQSSLFKGQMHICSNLAYNGVSYGVLSASGMYKGFSKGQVILFEEAAGFVTLYLRRIRQNVQDIPGLYGIERLLGGNRVDGSALENTIAPRGWKISDTYQVFCLNRGLSNEYANASYQKRIAKMFPNAVSLIYEDDIVIIENISKQSMDTEKLRSEFSFRGGSSLPFSDLNHLHNAYIQSRTALSYAKEKDIVPFGSVYSTYILDSIAQRTETGTLCHPKILELYESGEEKDRILIDVLRTYLLCGRNIAETARKLYVHRNTLLYRLEKLDRILGKKLDSIPEDEAFMYLISCMILTQKKDDR